MPKISLKENARKIFRRESVMTIPNLLSLFRLCLIPVLLWVYLKRQAYYAAAGIAVLSGATDVLDGWIARHFHMVSDLGKVLDPAADKLTQLAMLICLTARYPDIGWLLALLVVKELVQTLLGYLVVRRDGTFRSAKWYGKASTVTLYAVMVALFLFPELPQVWVDRLLLLCGGMLLLALVLYTRYYLSVLFAPPPADASGQNGQKE